MVLRMTWAVRKAQEASLCCIAFCWHSSACDWGVQGGRSADGRVLVLSRIL